MVVLEMVTIMEGFSEITLVLRAGVYVLMHHEEVVYVGKSKVMLGRIYTHRVAWGSKSRAPRTGVIPPKGILFNRVFIRPCPLAEVDGLEAELIARYHPRYNTQLRRGIPPELASIVGHLVARRPTPIRVERRGF
jgi:excinuclease UvrABC nuclease subunit